MKKNAFWEEAYNIGIEGSAVIQRMVNLLEEHDQIALAAHIGQLYGNIGGALAVAMPEKVAQRIDARIQAEQEAAFKAALDKLMAELPGAEVTDLEHFGEVFDAINTAV